GMANEAVGAGADEFVADLDSDGAGPVGAEIGPRPDGECEAESSDHDCEPAEPWTIGNDWSVPPAGECASPKEQVRSKPHGKGIGEAREDAFFFAGLLGLKGPCEPDDEPRDPEPAADLDCIHGERIRGEGGDGSVGRECTETHIKGNPSFRDGAAKGRATRFFFPP